MQPPPFDVQKEVYKISAFQATPPPLLPQKKHIFPSCFAFEERKKYRVVSLLMTQPRKKIGENDGCSREKQVGEVKNKGKRLWGGREGGTRIFQK